MPLSLPRWWYLLRGQLYPGDLETVEIDICSPHTRLFSQRRIHEADLPGEIISDDYAYSRIQLPPIPPDVLGAINQRVSLTRDALEITGLADRGRALDALLSDGVSLTSIAHPRRPWWSPRRWWSSVRDWADNYGGDDE